MSNEIPGPKARAILERGIPLFQNGLIFEDEVQKASPRKRFAIHPLSFGEI